MGQNDTDEHDDAFTCLNAAFVEDGALLTIQRDARIERPLHLLFVASDVDDGCRCGEHDAGTEYRLGANANALNDDAT